MKDKNPDPVKTERTLRRSAHASIIWGGIFTLARDVGQFATMIILVRLVSPRDYGAAAMAQSIFAVISIISYNTFSQYTLQSRSLDEVDWGFQMASGIMMNGLLFFVTCSISLYCYFVEIHPEVSLPLAALCFVLLVEIPGTLRQRMLEVSHNWGRFRILVIIGTLLGLGSGIITGILGGGLWALIIQYPMLALPCAIDLFVSVRLRPKFRWKAGSGREAICFMSGRIAALVLGRGRLLIEQGFISALFGLSTLGLFNRANGLAMITAGRIGTIAGTWLYPVLTRFDPQSAPFRRMSGILLRCVCWITIPGVALLSLTAPDIVGILYGNRWMGTAPFLPAVSATVGLYGIATILSSLLLANGDVRDSVVADLMLTGGTVITVAFYSSSSLEFYPIFVAMIATFAVMAASYLLVIRQGIVAGDVAAAYIPPLFSTGGAVFVLLILRSQIHRFSLGVVLDVIVFTFSYCGILRLFFANMLSAVVDMLPGRATLRRIMLY